MEPMKSSGPPAHLLGTVKASGKAQPNAISAADKGVIVGMETAAEDGTTAGAMGEKPKHGPGSQRQNIPGGVGDLIAGPGVHVP
jgi:hypothetical protein